MDTTKDIEINTHKFQIGRVPARDGSWIISVVVSGKFLDPDNYSRIQTILFAKISYIREVVGSAPIPQKFFENDRILIPELATDTDTLAILFDEALDFNVGPTLRRFLGKKTDEPAV